MSIGWMEGRTHGMARLFGVRRWLANMPIWIIFASRLCRNARKSSSQLLISQSQRNCVTKRNCCDCQKGYEGIPVINHLAPDFRENLQRRCKRSRHRISQLLLTVTVTKTLSRVSMGNAINTVAASIR